MITNIAFSEIYPTKGMVLYRLLVKPFVYKIQKSCFSYMYRGLIPDTSLAWLIWRYQDVRQQNDSRCHSDHLHPHHQLSVLQILHQSCRLTIKNHGAAMTLETYIASQAVQLLGC